MKLTRQQIELLSRYNGGDDSLTGDEWEIIWTMLDKGGDTRPDVTQHLCALALQARAMQPRPIAGVRGNMGDILIHCFTTKNWEVAHWNEEYDWYETQFDRPVSAVEYDMFIPLSSLPKAAP